MEEAAFGMPRVDEEAVLVGMLFAMMCNSTE